MPLKPRKSKLSMEQVRKIERDHWDRKEIQINSGLSAGQADRLLRAQKSKVDVKQGKELGPDLGDPRSEDFVALGDLDPQKGIIVANPITKKPETIVGRDNYVFNIDGTPTKRTAKHLAPE